MQLSFKLSFVYKINSHKVSYLLIAIQLFTQLGFTSLKSTVKTDKFQQQQRTWKDQKNGWILFKVNNKDTRMLSLTSFEGLLLTLNRFQTLLWFFSFWLWTNNYQLGKSVHCVTENQYYQWNLVNKNQINGAPRSVYHNIYDE